MGGGMIAFGVVMIMTICMAMVLFMTMVETTFGGGNDNAYMYGGPNTDRADAGPGVDLCNEAGDRK